MTNLVQLLIARASQTPRNTAFEYRRDNIRIDSLTYAELDLSARFAARQIKKYCRAGQKVVLMHPPGLDFIVDLFGCFYAGAIAVPSPSLHSRNHERFETIIESAAPRLILTTREALNKLTQYLTETKIEVPAMAIERGQDFRFPPYQAEANECAVIQYTSGSSSNPKGVILNHRNILANLQQMCKAFDFRIDERFEAVVLWLPHFHDMGLFARLQCIWTNCPCYLMSPLEFLRHPLRWLELISETGATVTGGPNFAYELCAEAINTRNPKDFDLSSWRVAFCGAEPMRHATLQRFVEDFTPTGVSSGIMMPCYGLAEATLLVSCVAPQRSYEVLSVNARAIAEGIVESVEDDQALRLVSCGYVCEEIDLKIVDPREKRILPSGRIGEIWLRGPNISAGYIDKEMIDRDHFDLPQNDRSGNEKYLRTGDLGFIVNNQLYISGRIKELIISHGRNIHPEDIENEVHNAHAALRNSRIAVFGVEKDKGEAPVVLFELPRRLKPGNPLLRKIFEAVHHRILDYFEIEPARILAIRPGKIILTTSGKVARPECRRALLEGNLEIADEWQPSQLDAEEYVLSPPSQIIVKLFEEVSEAGSLNPDVPIRTLGGDSLTMVRLISRIEESFGVEIDEIGDPSINSLAEKVDELLLIRVEAMSEEEAARLLMELETSKKD